MLFAICYNILNFEDMFHETGKNTYKNVETDGL